MADHRIFSCFDTRSDADLHALLVRQSERSESSLSIVDWSRNDRDCTSAEAELRKRIDAIDAVVVICGEFTDSSSAMSRELAIAQERGKPYVLLWGRRTLACTRPGGARQGDLFYTWIWDILAAQVAFKIRQGAEVEPCSRGRGHDSG